MNKLPIEFLHVNAEFISKLEKIDSRVQNNYSDSDLKKPFTHQKPYVSGILLSVNNRKYIAPLTSPKEKHKNLDEKSIKVIFRIQKHYKKNNKIEELGVILLNNMIPYVKEETRKIEFNTLDKSYKNLLEKQYKIIKDNIEKINRIAEFTYQQGCNRTEKFFDKICCDFKKLEDFCDKNYP